MSFAFGLPLTSKYTHAMSLGILKLQEQGITDSYERKWWEYQNQCPKETNAGKKGGRALMGSLNINEFSKNVFTDSIIC